MREEARDGKRKRAGLEARDLTATNSCERATQRDADEARKRRVVVSVSDIVVGQRVVSENSSLALFPANSLSYFVVRPPPPARPRSLAPDNFCPAATKTICRFRARVRAARVALHFSLARAKKPDSVTREHSFMNSPRIYGRHVTGREWILRDAKRRGGASRKNAKRTGPVREGLRARDK